MPQVNTAAIELSKVARRVLPPKDALSAAIVGACSELAAGGC